MTWLATFKLSGRQAEPQLDGVAVGLTDKTCWCCWCCQAKPVVFSSWGG